jgi:uncharacterized membrane protein YhaH (DUF805 family)
MFCHSCGTALAPAAAFCTNCGQQLAASPIQAQVITPPLVQPQQWQGQPNQGQQWQGQAWQGQPQRQAQVSFGEAINNFWNRYAQFEGRASRAEYWWSYLFYVVSSLFLTIIDTVFGTYPLLTLLFALATLIPNLAVAARRMHDVGKSGTYLLFGLIPFVGGILVLIELVKEADPRVNMYGAPVVPTR